MYPNGIHVIEWFEMNNNISSFVIGGVTTLRDGSGLSIPCLV